MPAAAFADPLAERHACDPTRRPLPVLLGGSGTVNLLATPGAGQFDGSNLSPIHTVIC
jgi:hypothetical protein